MAINFCQISMESNYSDRFEVVSAYCLVCSGAKISHDNVESLKAIPKIMEK